MTSAEVLQLARQMTGHTLRTARGARFAVGWRATPPGSPPLRPGTPRCDGAAALARFVTRYNETGSLRPGDYQDITRNSSYYAALLRAAVSRPGVTGVTVVGRPRGALQAVEGLSPPGGRPLAPDLLSAPSH